MADRQFVTVKFNPWDQRSYTYHNDQAPLMPGDKVLVVTPKEGEKEVVVDTAWYGAPPAFATKEARKVLSEPAVQVKKEA